MLLAQDKSPAAPAFQAARLPVKDCRWDCSSPPPFF